ncbi:DUF3307 domain-containing protein [Piscibacillus sp. B03]|uniref:DUF3307 domain-containing protein n=1 Tax=Piscibacillus sp. B03 TaxID=3457430 RepID=UPI003FCC6FDB
MTYALLLILAHFLADFTFQSDKLIEGRKSHENKVRRKALIKHAFIHFVTYIAFILVGMIFIQSINLLNILSLFVIVLLITVTHFEIDAAKYHLDQQVTSQKWKAITFIGDQLLHILIIVIPTLYLMESNIISNPAANYWLSLLILFYLNTIVASHFLQIVLGKIAPPNTFEQIVEEEVDRQEPNQEESLTHTVVTKSKTSYPDSHHKIGRYIGMLERTLIMMFVFSGQVMGITIILAIKSITRFKQFDDKRFAEYYLIGSLLSMIIGIIFGYLASRL